LESGLFCHWLLNKSCILSTVAFNSFVVKSLSQNGASLVADEEPRSACDASALSEERPMKAGRYIRDAACRAFFVRPDGRAFDWEGLHSEHSTERVCHAVQTFLNSGSAAAFCAALPHIGAFVDNGGADTQSRDQSRFELPAEVFSQPLPAPLTPATFICVGLNYRDHAAEAKMQIPATPVLFAKTANAVTGHNQPIEIPPDAEQVDYEAELAVVIARPCRDIALEDALSYVAGYTCANDVSARDFQFSDGQWFRGKSCDGFGPLGPWIVTPDEIVDPHAVAVRCRLNGRVMQDSNTRNLIFTIPQLIAFVSRTMTLQPGDVILTGTPPGVGFARTPSVFLSDADAVEVEIDGIGVLRNTFVRRKNTTKS
jgi:2-keto-4-pentenoate hydratase/2-oxohepta-3-ene-1,7-dioic acid hydratase in catechol pathway